jgi:hypothetical protein
MAKKTKKPLLQEGTIRRMMKLANMEVLGDNFLSEKYAPFGEEEADLEEQDDLEAGGIEDIEAAAIEEPGEDIEALDVETEESPGEIEAEVTVEDADVDALKTARDVLDQVISAAGDEGAEDELDVEEELPGEEVEEIGAEVEDLEAPGNRSEMDLYEAALSGLGVELIDDKAAKIKSKIEEVKQQVYKRVIERLLKESKK